MFCAGFMWIAWDWLMELSRHIPWTCYHMYMYVIPFSMAFMLSFTHGTIIELFFNEYDYKARIQLKVIYQNKKIKNMKSDIFWPYKLTLPLCPVNQLNLLALPNKNPPDLRKRFGGNSYHMASEWTMKPKYATIVGLQRIWLIHLCTGGCKYTFMAFSYYVIASSVPWPVELEPIIDILLSFLS